MWNVRHNLMWPFRKNHREEDIDQKRLNAFGPLAVVSSMCIGPQRFPVMHGSREAPNNISDSGWTLSSCQESKDFAADSNNFKLVPLERMIDTDSTLALLKDLPVGTEITLRVVFEPWRFIVDDKVVDEDGRVIGGWSE